MFYQLLALLSCALCDQPLLSCDSSRVSMKQSTHAQQEACIHLRNGSRTSLSLFFHCNCVTNRECSLSRNQLTPDLWHWSFWRINDPVQRRSVLVLASVWDLWPAKVPSVNNQSAKQLWVLGKITFRWAKGNNLLHNVSLWPVYCSPPPYIRDAGSDCWSGWN